MNRPIVIFDLETTGTDLSSDRIVQIACLKVSHDFSEIGELKNHLINPLVPIPEDATKCHGITNDHVKDKPKFIEIAKSLYEYLSGCDLLGFNSNRFDVPLLAEEFIRADPFYTFPDADTKLLDAYQIFASKEKRDLTAAYMFYCGKVMEGAHEAGNDLMATMEIFRSQLLRYEDINQMNVHELHDFCGGSVRVDLAGSIILNEEGVAVYAIGKDKGKSVVKNPSFAQWMLKTPTFCSNTKNVLKRMLNYK